MSFWDRWSKPSWAGIRSVFRKELLQLFRDKYLMAFIITLPILQLVVTGLAIEREVTQVPTLIYNYDKRNASLELIKAFRSSQFFEVDKVKPLASEETLHKYIRDGRYRLGVIIPPDYSEKLLSGETAELNLVLDGTNAATSKIVLTAVQSVVANFGVRLATDQLGEVTPKGEGSLIRLNKRILYNEDLKTSRFLIPGILAIVMHMMTVLFTSFSIVRERESGTLELLMVTPIRVTDLMIGKILPYAAIGMLDMLLTLGVMVAFFNIPISGGFGFLLIASTIFIVSSLGVGLLISTSCQSQVQAIQLTVGLLLPSLMLSGFVFPIEPMPWFIKVVSYLMPLTYYLEVIRGVVLKGLDFGSLWPQTLTLTLFSLVMVGASVIRFKKQV